MSCLIALSAVIASSTPGRVLYLSRSVVVCRTCRRRHPERRRERARIDRADQVGLVLEDALEVAVRLLFRDVLAPLDLPCRYCELVSQRVDLFLRGIGLHVDLELDAVLPLVRAVVDPLLEEKDPAQEQQGHGDRQDPGQRHQQVPSQRDQRLAREVGQAPHDPVSSRRRRRREPGRAPCARDRAR